jgi:hypothetical protein
MAKKESKMHEKKEKKGMGKMMKAEAKEMKVLNKLVKSDKKVHGKMKKGCK